MKRNSKQEGSADKEQQSSKSTCLEGAISMQDPKLVARTTMQYNNAASLSRGGICSFLQKKFDSPEQIVDIEDGSDCISGRK